MNIKNSYLLLLTTSLGVSSLSYGAGSPWINPPGSFSIGITQVEQTADQFYIGNSNSDLPDDLELSTTQIEFKYGINDQLAIDAKTGYAKSNFDALDNDSELSGITDTNIGLTWQFHNEYSSDSGLPTAAVRVGAIIAGDYSAGEVNSIGDGGNGYEASLIFGKSINPYLAFSAELGYRNRSEGIPDENFYSLSAYITPIQNLTTFISYNIDDARNGLDIDGPGFGPGRFPQTEEDKTYVQLGGQYQFTNNISSALTLARVIDGRNTSDSDVVALTANFSF